MNTKVTLSLTLTAVSLQKRSLTLNILSPCLSTLGKNKHMWGAAFPEICTIKARRDLRSSLETKAKRTKRLHNSWCRLLHTSLPAPAHPARTAPGLIVASSPENIWGTRRLTRSLPITPLSKCRAGMQSQVFLIPKQAS